MAGGFPMLRAPAMKEAMDTRGDSIVKACEDIMDIQSQVKKPEPICTCDSRSGFLTQTKPAEVFDDDSHFGWVSSSILGYEKPLLTI